MSIARHHAEWLRLLEVSGPFLSLPVLLKAFPQGLDGLEPFLVGTVRSGYKEWQAGVEKGRANIQDNWVRFVLREILGIRDDSVESGQAIPEAIRVTLPEHGETLRPDLVVAEPSSKLRRLLVQVYPPTQDLEKPIRGKVWKASPASRMAELLRATGVRLGLVTNGERWMLVDAPHDEATGYASWYAALWLEERVTLQSFRSLLGAERFFAVAEAETLEALLTQSATDQQDVTDRLGYQVRKAVELLVESLDRADHDHGRALLGDVAETDLYEAALTIMMRLVFLFCAEERGLLLLGDPLYDEHYAVSTLRDQLREAADQHGEDVLERRHDAWCRLLATFRAVHGGISHERLVVPPYGGNLFDPDRFPFLEGRTPGTAWRGESADPLPVSNRAVLHLLEALQLLQVKLPGGGPAEARRLSFRALDIEQIGHVYEGLLDHTARRAKEPTLGLAGSNTKNRDYEPEVSLSELEQLRLKGTDALVDSLVESTKRNAKALKRLLDEPLTPEDERRYITACGSGEEGAALWKRLRPFAPLIRDDSFGYAAIIRAGSVYVTEGTDRRSSGTQYTPRSLTEPVVRYALEPLVYEGPSEGKPREEWKLRSPAEILALKICDFACGSGAFLVQVCRYLAERLVEAWEALEAANPGAVRLTPEGDVSAGLPEERLIPKDPEERLAYARRIVAQRCLYGVDVNPLAVEMAKLSLWLLTLAKDKPFTFLDHCIRCGDSLLGITSLDQLKRFSLADGPVQKTISQQVSFDDLIDHAIDTRLRIESMDGDTIEHVAAQEGLLAEAEEKMGRLKAAADQLVAAEIGDVGRDEAIRHATAALVSPDLAKVIGTPVLRSQRRRPFHWPLEFPEVMVKGGGSAHSSEIHHSWAGR
ncbi:MAG: type IIL restriction-modification enzyme MmeI [Thermoanaerobaculia bacterium]